MSLSKRQHLKKYSINPKEGRKEGERIQKQVGQIENKRQDGRFKSHHVNNNIKYKLCKHYK